MRRRELIVAVGLAAGAATVVDREWSTESDEGPGGRPFGEQETRTLMALSEIVYPSAVDYDEGFVMGHVESRNEERQQGIHAALDDLNAYARQWYGRSFPSLQPETRRSLLRDLGVGRAGSDPDSTVPERIRYYLVNQLLFALYTDPRGSQLFGIDNPVGYPGGYESYQESPER